MAFAAEWNGNALAAAKAFDIKTDDAATAPGKWADYTRLGVNGVCDAAAAADGSPLLLSLVTADRALAAAQSVAPHLTTGALYCDFNSVAPHTKLAAAAIVEAAGGLYIDVAIMAPVRPPALATPLLVSGPHAGTAIDALSSIGFAARPIGARIGDAAMIKMLRSIMVKGLEALSAECFLAAAAAGLTDEVVQSLPEPGGGADWASIADYNLDRMMVHGLRRAAEMEEVAEALEALGADGTMSRAAAEAQRRIGAMRLQPASGLPAKSRMILERCDVL